MQHFIYTMLPLLTKNEVHCCKIVLCEFNQWVMSLMNCGVIQQRESKCFLILLRARRNEKEMKVKPATSFKLLTIFIHKKIRQDSKQKNVS